MSFKIKVLVFLATILVVAGAVKVAYNRAVDRYFPFEYKEEITKYSKESGLNINLVMAVINAESGFDPNAHSGVAKGLMQITDETAMWICNKMEMTYYEDMAYAPETNIKMGCWYLSYLVKKYRSVDTALAAYNAGAGNVNKWLENPEYSSDGKTLSYIPFEETRNYVLRVRKMMGIYQKAY